jgi:hypothetical protein
MPAATDAITSHDLRAATKANVARFDEAMVSLGLDAKSVPQVAEFLGYDETTIRRIKKGEFNVSLGLLKTLKAHVGVVEALRICNLLGDDEIGAVERELQAA